MFIVVEGPDGCGKSYHANLLKERLKAKFFKFPNKESPTGKLIYEHLESKWFVAFDGPPNEEHPREALVFQALQSANRMESSSEIIKADLTGNVVLDRYWPSGFAYGKADGLDGQYLINLHTLLPAPDLCILLDIDIKESIDRRPERRDRYERNMPFMEKVMQNYRELWAMNLYPIKWITINARGSKEETAKLIEDCIAQYKELL